MNLADTRVVLRLRGVTEVLDLAFMFLARNARSYLLASVATIVPALLACAAARGLAGWSWRWVWAAAVLLGELAQGAFTVLAGRLLFEEKPKVRPLLAKSLRRLPAYAIAMLLAQAVIASAAIAVLGDVHWLAVVLVILGVAVWRRALFVGEVVLLEDSGAFASLGRTARFIKRHETGAFGMITWMLAAQAGFVVVAEALGWGVVQFTLQLGQPFGSLREGGGSLYALAGFFASVPYVATARFLHYIDIRTRKEGWDIALRFRAIQLDGEAPKPGARDEAAA